MGKYLSMEQIKHMSIEDCKFVLSFCHDDLVNVVAEMMYDWDYLCYRDACKDIEMFRRDEDSFFKRVSVHDYRQCVNLLVRIHELSPVYR